MQHDEVIWQVVNQQFCSYKMKADRANFCRNKYNVSGLCLRQACPLANSRYATVLEHRGRCYLYIKSIERAHSPRNLWEKIPLPKNYAKALEIVSKSMMYWPNYNVHRCKQRLTKIHQYLIRMRKLKLTVRPQLVPIIKRVERREKVREAKAVKMANVDEAIKNELLERLRQGVYGDLYAPHRVFKQALKEIGRPDQESETVDAPLEDEEGEGEDELEWEEEEEDEDEVGPSEFVEAYDGDIMDEDDIEELDQLHGGDSDDDRPAAAAGKKGAGGSSSSSSSSARAAGRAARGAGKGKGGGGSDDDEDGDGDGGDQDGGDGPSRGKGRREAKPEGKAKGAKGASGRARRHVELEYEREEERQHR